MRFLTTVFIALLWSLLASSGSQMARSAENPLVQQLEDKAFADLTQRDQYKVSDAVDYFIQAKTPAAEVVPRVLPLLKVGANDDNDNAILAGLADLLEHYGPQAEAAIPQLIEIAPKTDKHWVSWRIRDALAAIGPNDERVFNALRNEVRAPRLEHDRVFSAIALSRMGPIAMRAIPDFNRQIVILEKNHTQQLIFVNDADAYLSPTQAVAFALERIVKIVSENGALPSMKNALQTLKDVKNAPPDKIILAFLSLQKSAAAARSAVPTLLEIVNRGPEYSRSGAIRTLGIIGQGVNARVTQTLLKILEDGSKGDDQSFLSKEAGRALRSAKAKDAAGVPLLTEALKSSDAKVRTTAAAAALAGIGPASAPASVNLSALIRAFLNDETVPVNSYDWSGWTDLREFYSYISLAIAIGKDKAGLLDALLEVIHSPNFLRIINEKTPRANLWVAVAGILTKSGDDIPVTKRRLIAEGAVQVLHSASQGERTNPFLFIGAARAVGALREMGQDAVPILVKKLQSETWLFQGISEWDGVLFPGSRADTTAEIGAMRALGRIGKPAAEDLPILQIIAETKKEEDTLNTSLPDSAQVARDAIAQINAAT